MSLAVRSPLVLVGLTTVALAACGVAAITSKGGYLVIAVLLLLPVATSLGKAGRLAASLQGFRRRPVSAVVWGTPIQGAAAGTLRMDSIGAMGVGLLIYLAGSKESRTLLKVAQPSSWRLEEGRLVIEEAAYVQWAGKRLPRAEGSPAVTISLVMVEPVES